MFIPLLCTLSFLTGVLLASLSDFYIPGSLGLLVALLLFKKPRVALLGLCFLLGVWRVEFYERGKVLDPPYGNVELTGRIVEEVDQRNDHQKITVQTEWGRVLAKISLYHEVAYGDQVSLRGTLEAPSEDIEGFSYANYLARYRIWLVMSDAQVHVVQAARASPRGWLYGFKTRVEQRLNRLYFEPEASFAAGLLLGSRKGMPQDLADAFQAVGLTHIVAISGYNITLVIAAMFLMFSFLPLKSRVVVSSVAIFIFVVLVGASAAVVRAGIMGVLTLWALFSGHKSQVFFALLWSAVVMVIFNPYILAFDVGFQLSFASTFGLLVFVPILEKALPGKASIFKEALSLTLAAQVATFPLMTFHFGRVSLLSPLANVLVAPFLPFAMFFAMLSLIFGKSFALLAWFHLKAVESFALFLAKWPYSQVSLKWSKGEFILSWVLMGLFLLIFYRSTLARCFGFDLEAVSSTLLHPAWKKHVKSTRPPV